MSGVRHGVFEVIDGGGPTVTVRVRCPACNEIVATHTYPSDISVADAAAQAGPVGATLERACAAHRCLPP